MPGPSRRFPRKIVPAFFAALVGCVALFSAPTPQQELQELRRAFEQPPDDSRPMMRWWWFGPAVTDAGLEREMRTMKEGGIGGFEEQPVYPLAPDDETQGIRNAPFLSPRFLEALKFTSVKARELELRMDLTLGSGWYPLPDYKLLNLRYGVRFEPQDMDMVKALPAGLLGRIRLVPRAPE